MVVQKNLNAKNAHNKLGANVIGAKKSSEKLSSGFRINRAGDDAAGLAVSEKMRALSKSGYSVNMQNINKGLGMVATADGAMQEIHAISHRMRELSVMVANGTYNDELDREAVDLEFQALKSEIERIITSTEYNGIKVFEGRENIVNISVPGNTFSTVSFNDNHVVNWENDTLTFRYNGIAYDGITRSALTLAHRPATNPYTNDELVEAINAEFIRLGVNVTAFIDSGTNSLVFDAHGGVFDSFGGNMMSTSRSNSIISNIIHPGEGRLGITSRGGRIMTSPGGQRPTGNRIQTPHSFSGTSGVLPSFNVGDNYPITGINPPNVLISSTVTSITHHPAIPATDGPNSGSPERWSFTVSYVVERDEMEADPTIPPTFADVNAFIQRQTSTDFQDPIVIDSRNNGFTIRVTNPNANPAMYDINLTLPIGSHTTAEMNTILTNLLTGYPDVNVIGGTNLRLETTGEGESWSITLPNSPALFTLYGTRTEAIAEGRINLTANPITNIVKGVNDVLEFDLNINGNISRHSITISEGRYNNESLIQAVNQAISEKGIEGVRFERLDANSGIEGPYMSTRLIYTPQESGFATISGVGGSAAYSVFYRGLIGEHIIPPDKVKLQVGPRGITKEHIYVTNIPIEITLRRLGIKNSSISTRDEANEAIGKIDRAVRHVSLQRAKSGADYNALGTALSNVTSQNENLISAESRIRDTDMAKEMIKHTKYNILQQVAQAMLAQAKDVPQGVLQLLQ